MQEIEAKYFHLIAGAGNFADNRGSNGRVNNNGGNKNNSSSTAIKAATPALAQRF
ncbi:hypothetical protein I5M92_04160 [Serratia marcescens]|nr:hypothetical protein [Serratia marcescens]HEJ0329349.1 hypothetical protein [Serratia marcescens]